MRCDLAEVLADLTDVLTRDGREAGSIRDTVRIIAGKTIDRAETTERARLADRQALRRSALLESVASVKPERIRPDDSYNVRLA